jgi:dolichol-phosphate mannosyltransferase
MIWVILPAFNEERDLPQLLERIKMALTESGLPYRVLVVDDGSSDRTAEVARLAGETMPVLVESHAINQGLGATIRDGLLKACEMADPHDVLVTLDADNTHTPELILRMVRTVREGLDVVVASRYRPGSRVRGVPLARRILSRVASWLFRLLFPIKGIRDYTCGYRAYRAGALQEVIARSDGTFFEEEGFQAMVDILLKLRRDKDLIFGEVPLILRYDLKEGASKMDIGRTIRRTLSLVVRRLANRG